MNMINLFGTARKIFRHIHIYISLYVQFGASIVSKYVYDGSVTIRGTRNTKERDKRKVEVASKIVG